MRRGVALATVAAAALAATVAGCGGEPGGTPGVSELTAPAGPDRTAVAARVAEQVVVPAYRELATETAALAAAVAPCRAGSAPDEARDAYRRARTAWFATAAFRFGPAMDLDAEPAIAFTADTAKIDDLLATTPDAPLTETDVERLGADQRGLEGIEHVLFGEGPSARACSYLMAAGALVAAKADALARAWTTPTGGKPPAIDQLRTPGGASMWADGQEVIADLVNGVIAALNLATDRQLGPAAGAGGDTPDPAGADSGPARHALADIDATIGSARRVIDGGLGELVQAQSSAAFRRLDRQLTDSRTAVAAIPAPLHDVPATGADAVDRAYQQVRAARITMRTEVASLLGVTLSFSDSDGDS